MLLCKTCGAAFIAVRRGECLACGSDEGSEEKVHILHTSEELLAAIERGPDATLPE